MLDYQRFGYRRIRVLRPLRMMLHVNAETIGKLKEQKAWIKLPSSQQGVWEVALLPHLGKVHPFGWAEVFATEVAQCNQDLGKVGKTFIKALINAFGTRDPVGEPVKDSNGDIVPDTDLTEYENVPMSESIRDYFAREVLPHLEDAYIDETFRDDLDGDIGRVGYEINFNRFFYKFVPPRKLHDIDLELKQVEAEIAQLLGEVTE